MNREQWLHLKIMFHVAVQLKENDRDAYLMRTCPDDDSLRSEVKKLLAQAETMPDDYLHPPDFDQE